VSAGKKNIIHYGLYGHLSSGGIALKGTNREDGMATFQERTRIGQRPEGPAQTAAQFGSFKAADKLAPGTYAEDPIVKPMILSHGTLGVIDLEESKRFYTEFLGLHCVRHSKTTLNVRMGGYWSIVCLKIGDAVQPTRVYHHWGLDVATPEEVDAAYEAALKYKDKYGIRVINKPRPQHTIGDYAFKLQDRDGNWWEIQYIVEPMKYDKRFAQGDITPT
jgi:catechol 2,3-dioxygenase-like lactoylglutathione lyase family enzyme